MKGKNTFTQEEINLLRQLIRMRVKASDRGDTSATKRIRNQMRAVGFWGRDDFGIIDMQIQDLDRLIASCSIVVLGIPQQVSEIEHSTDATKEKASKNTAVRNPGKRQNSDESYIIDLCDEVLGQKASRQHTFDFLRGDSNNSSLGKKLPVDAYYASLSLVVEFAERQHSETVTFFDKPDRMTISGVHRGEQRRIYDQRRHQLLPLHGIKMITFSYEEFAHDRRKKLVRSKEIDLRVIAMKINSL